MTLIEALDACDPFLGNWDAKGRETGDRTETYPYRATRMADGRIGFYMRVPPRQWGLDGEPAEPIEWLPVEREA